MEELRGAAFTHYNNMPHADKQLLFSEFSAIDKSGKGKISFRQYSDYFRQFLDIFKDIGLPVELLSLEFFKAMDKNGDGKLDFGEYILVYYLAKNNKLIFCEECKAFLCGSYISCLQCFTHDSRPHYNVCLACYRSNNIDHHKDATFVASHKLHQYVANSAAQTSGTGKTSTENFSLGHATAKGVNYVHQHLTQSDTSSSIDYSQSAYDLSNNADLSNHVESAYDLSNCEDLSNNVQSAYDFSNYADLSNHVQSACDLSNYADLSNHIDTASSLSDGISTALDVASLCSVM